MPLEYHISPDEGLITVHGAGEVHLDDLARLGRSLLGDAAYDPCLPQLLDFRGLRPRRVSRQRELRAFVHGTYRHRVNGNVAVVIDDHLEHHHAAEIYLLTCAIDQAELFCDYDQAIKWLMRRAFAVPASADEHDAAGDDGHRAPE